MTRLLVVLLLAVVAAVFGVRVSRRGRHPEPVPQRVWSPELVRLIEATGPRDCDRKVAV